MTITNEEGKQEKQDYIINRQDFVATTANKQLNFMQHIKTLLKLTGEAAVVFPTMCCLKVEQAKRCVKN